MRRSRKEDSYSGGGGRAWCKQGSLVEQMTEEEPRDQEIRVKEIAERRLV